MAIEVDPEVMQKYVGRYELQLGFILTISMKDNSLFVQGTNQPEFPMFAESESSFS